MTDTTLNRLLLTTFAATAFALAAGHAHADVAGTGTFAVQYDVTFSPTFTQTSGAISFDNNPQVIAGGVPVNLGLDVGNMTLVSGTATASTGSPPSGLVSAQYTSVPLGFNIDGSYICNGPTGCGGLGVPFDASFVADLSAIVGSALPTGAGISYTSDGFADCTTFQDPFTLQVFSSCTGTLGINVFGAVNTPVDPNPSSFSEDVTFFDPITGQEVTVTVGVQFDEVTQAGETTVTATSNEPGDIPPNFATQVGDYQAAFLNVSTTAVVEPPIRVCGSYPDANNDGIVDGTEVPPEAQIPECQMEMLHRPDPAGAFEAVTLRATDPNCPSIAPANRCPGVQPPCIDTAQNFICGEVDGLSPFVVAVDLTPPPFEVVIDAAPSVNPMSQGNLRVHLLGSASFHVADVDSTTLALGPNGAGPAHAVTHYDDVNEDGAQDMVLHFSIPETGIAVGDKEVCMSGELLNGLAFEGCDNIRTTPRCGGGFSFAFIAPVAAIWLARRRRDEG